MTNLKGLVSLSESPDMVCSSDVGGEREERGEGRCFPVGRSEDNWEIG